jgi:prepilin-type processing-associated H-X9-DG protein
MYANANSGFIPQKGPDGTNTSDNYFGPYPSATSNTNNWVGVDDPSLWFNAIPKYVVKKSYYEMLLDDQNGKTPLYTQQGAIFTCPTQLPPSTFSNKDIISSDSQFFLLNGIDSQGKLAGIGGGNYFKFNATYVYNSKFTDVIAPSMANGLVPPNQPTLRITKCKPADRVIVMIEKVTAASEYMDPGVQKFNKAYSMVYNGDITAKGLLKGIAQSKANWKRFTTRHRGGGYILFADGHVGWFSWTDTQIQPSQMVPNYNPARSDANQPARMIWSLAGPIN